MEWNDAFAECMLERRPVSIFRHPFLAGNYTFNEWNWPPRYTA